MSTLDRTLNSLPQESNPAIIYGEAADGHQVRVPIDDIRNLLKFQQCTLAEYQAMASHEENTLYLITNLDTADEGRTL